MAVSGEVIPPSTEPSQDGVRDDGGFSGWTEFDVAAGPVQPCKVYPTRMTEKRRSTALPWAETPTTSPGEMPPNQFTADE